jgi:asparagine synthase (glutamine-hydrolysing)
MCGIAGLLAPRLDGPERLARVEAMVECLRHRGPSGVALWDGDGLALGLARLAIVAPNQPARVATNERSTVHAVVNGEVYNHDELLAELRGRGHEVPDGPDTAVIPHLYEEVGGAFPRRLDGMFAVGIWDEEARRLTLARDRAGEKPLFVAESDDEFAFASEPAALLTLPWVSRDVDAAALARFLVHGFFAGDETGFASIRALPPAHVIERDAAGHRRTRYWRPWDALGQRPAAPDAGAAIAATRDGLARAVAVRVPGEVPFGVFLSGGVDSSLVAVLAARAHERRFPTFSLRLPDRGYDESAYARTIAERIGSEHHELSLDAAAGEEALESYAADMDLPLGDPSVLPTWALARLAARHVPVVLTGEGGDELFAGYPTYLGHRWAGLARAVPGPLRAAILGVVRRTRPRHHHVTIAHLVERFLESAALDPFERHVRWFGTASADESRALLAPGLRAAAGDREPLAHLDRLWDSIGDSPAAWRLEGPDLAAYQLLDFELYLSGDLLAKVDRATMAHGLESRAPFLSHRLIEQSLALPATLKLRGKTGKWVLKEAARELLPPAVRTRRKQGFSPPFSAWARGPLRGLVESRLAPERLARAGVLDPGAVHDVLRAHVAGRVDRGRTLWTLLSLQMWVEKWVCAPALAPAEAPAPARATELTLSNAAR